jgi:two-component system, cell cycle sensor histidine kinase and response regulator CckA
MKKTEYPKPDSVREPASIRRLAGQDSGGTQTIDLNSLFSEELTTSGSFDLRKVKLATFTNLLQALSVPTLLINRSHVVEFCNKAFTGMTGILEALGNKFSSIFANPEEARSLGLLLEKVFVQRQPEVGERNLRLGHRAIWCRVHLRTIRIGTERFVLVQFENLTAQKELLAVQKYQKLVKIFPIGMAEFSLRSPLDPAALSDSVIEEILQARLTDGNNEFGKMYDRSIEDLFGVTLGKLLSAKSKMRTVYEKWVQMGFQPFSFETSEARPQYETRHFEHTLIGNSIGKNLHGLWWLKRDISEKKRMEEEILKAQKLESLGVLAGGIAHDFNNLLMAIGGNIALGQSHSKLTRESAARFEAAMKATNRAQDLTRQLLTFSKGGAPVKSTASLSQLLTDCMSFVLRGSSVRCHYSVPEDLWPVDMDEGQISQVINNLAINALEAMPRGGAVLVRAQNVHIGKEQKLSLKEGRYVRVSIADRGEGITREHISKIFDPYFTTKEKGSGLGLASSYSIIKKHDGLLTLRSKVGVGTTFYFFLPAASIAPPQQEQSVSEPFRGQGRILIMDDEEMIRESAGKLVRGLGYEVVLAKEGSEAVLLYRTALREGKRFHAVILDLTVPGGMGGRQALLQLKEIDPGVRAIVSSGYSNDPVMSDHSRWGFSAVLPKPYNVHQLGQALARVVGAGAGARSRSEKNGAYGNIGGASPKPIQ